MGLKQLSFFFLAVSSLSAASRLRLSTTTVGPVSLAEGSSNSTQIVEAYNAGDGALSLSVRSAFPWISGVVGAPRSCTSRSGQCIPITVTINAAQTAKGIQTGTLQVLDPNAHDAPQWITVVAQVGGGVPDQVTLLTTPGGSASATFQSNSLLSNRSDQSWTTVRLDGGGTFGFVRTYRIDARAPQPAPGVYTANVTTSGSALAVENKTFPVRLIATASPIAKLAPESLQLRYATGLPAQKSYIGVANTGQGNLALASITTSANATWLTARIVNNSLVEITADPSKSTPGLYTGQVGLTGNFANVVLIVPVTMEVTAQAPPIVSYNGALNNANYAVGEPIAQGGLVAMFGEQFTYRTPAPDSKWPGNLDGVSVFVNGVAAPVNFVSYGQLNFQMPYGTAPGTAAVQVVRDGIPGNAISVEVKPSVPRIMEWAGLGGYGIMINAVDGTLPLPPGVSLPSYISKPAVAGDYLLIYGLGFGPTVPPVDSGAAPPSEPLARVPGANSISIGESGPVAVPIPVTPQYVGLTPGFVGLYQINLQLPPGVPASDRQTLRILSNGQATNNILFATR